MQKNLQPTSVICPSPSCCPFLFPLFQTPILLFKSPSVCCCGFNLRSLTIPPQSSPHLSTNLSIHSLSRWLCVRGRFGLPYFACSSNSGTIPLPTPFTTSSPSDSLSSFNGSPKGFSRSLFSRWTLTIAPVLGSLVTLTSDFPNSETLRDVGIDNECFRSLSDVVDFAFFSVPPV